MALVPDNFTFSLQDVYAVTGYSDLYNSFINSVSTYRDPSYWGVEQGMRQFRNYGPKDYFYIDHDLLYFDNMGLACGTDTIHVTTNLTWNTIVDNTNMSGSYIDITGGTGDAYVTWHCGGKNLKEYDQYGSITFRNYVGGAQLAYAVIIQYPSACV
jgi:hypothetical protein